MLLRRSTRGVSWRRLIVVAAFGVLIACNQGAPYAFRLMVPPHGGQYLPYWFWEEREVFHDFKECTTWRDDWRVLHKWYTAWQSLPVTDRENVRRELERKRHAECVPLR